MSDNKYILLKDTLENELKYELIPEYKFDTLIHNQTKKRLWRFDFAILEHKIAVEVEGGIFGFNTAKGFKKIGSHNSISGIKRDIEKYNKAMCLGWSVFRILSSDAKNKLNKIYDLAELIKNKIKNDQRRNTL